MASLSASLFGALDCVFGPENTCTLGGMEGKVATPLPPFSLPASHSQSVPQFAKMHSGLSGLRFQAFLTEGDWQFLDALGLHVYGADGGAVEGVVGLSEYGVGLRGTHVKRLYVGI